MTKINITSTKPNKINSTTDVGINLSNITDVPKKLYTVGNERLLHKPVKTVCIVGSRRYSSYGHDVVRDIMATLKGHDVTIVSGLALGIDTLVHTYALENGLKCIAVPASGLNEDVIYPRTNVELSQEIVKKGGLLVSEFEPDFRASPWSFPMRNRIMAGMADVVIIIEGEKDSGTLITARLAKDYGREVIAVPQGIFSETGEGCNYLIAEEGATMLRSAESLLDILNLK